MALVVYVCHSPDATPLTTLDDDEWHTRLRLRLLGFDDRDAVVLRDSAQGEYLSDRPALSTLSDMIAANEVDVLGMARVGDIDEMALCVVVRIFDHGGRLVEGSSGELSRSQFSREYIRQTSEILREKWRREGREPDELINEEARRRLSSRPNGSRTRHSGSVVGRCPIR